MFLPRGVNKAGNTINDWCSRQELTRPTRDGVEPGIDVGKIRRAALPYHGLRTTFGATIRRPLPSQAAGRTTVKARWRERVATPCRWLLPQIASCKPASCRYLSARPCPYHLQGVHIEATEHCFAQLDSSTPRLDARPRSGLAWNTGQFEGSLEHKQPVSFDYISRQLQRREKPNIDSQRQMRDSLVSIAPLGMAEKNRRISQLIVEHSIRQTYKYFDLKSIKSFYVTALTSSDS